MPLQTVLIIAFGVMAVGLACVAVFKLNEKNMLEIEANQKEINRLANHINEIVQSENSDNENKIDSKD